MRSWSDRMRTRSGRRISKIDRDEMQEWQDEKQDWQMAE